MNATMMHCGLCYWEYGSRVYLPRISTRAHATILSSVSRTTLTQTFVNPKSETALPELQYVFPLYDGVSVVAFTCTIGERVIHGVVKENVQARAEYQEAVNRGAMAGLLEQSPDAADVFSTSIGNIPAGATVVVDTTYLGELKHDAGLDSIRFTIPTVLAPRYGGSQGFPSMSQSGGADSIDIVVDVEMPQHCAIKTVQSPSHPISVSIGTTSLMAPDAERSLCRASATLALGGTALDCDFVLHVIAANTDSPVAVLEHHPSLQGQCALMATLVPKFTLPAERPEIVFLCDRSGSMGNRIPSLVSALQIFLKSLPVGVKFNICSFGSHFDFLWPRSHAYDQQSVNEAMHHVASFDANYGGTEMYAAVEATFKQRYADLNLEVFLLTDGEIWAQDSLFALINKVTADSNGAIRLFSIGIGNDVSHALIEGVARAGNGFAQTVADGEKMDKKIVRMLKASISPHINNYSLEVKYGKDSGITGTTGSTETHTHKDDDDDDDFELVEKVLDCLHINVKDSDSSTVNSASTASAIAPAKATISLFNPTADVDAALRSLSASPEEKYGHLPAVTVPKLLQAPYQIPALFSFSRTNVYLLMSGTESLRRPVSVVLRGTSTHGPLELEIPVSDLGQGETIHQLAARKAVKDLEEGRGWLPQARKLQSDGRPGPLLKEEYEGRFSEMVEREAVRLGIQYQVAGKWCSFVAVDTAASTAEPTLNRVADCVPPKAMADVKKRKSVSPTSAGSVSALTYGSTMGRSVGHHHQYRQMAAQQMAAQHMHRRHIQQQVMAAQHIQAQAQQWSIAQSQSAAQHMQPRRAIQQSQSAAQHMQLRSIPQSYQVTGQQGPQSSQVTGQQGLQCAAQHMQVTVQQGPQCVQQGPQCQQVQMALANFGATQPAPPPSPGAAPLMSQAFDSCIPYFRGGGMGGGTDPLSQLVALQTFEGSWAWSSQLAAILGVTIDRVHKQLTAAGPVAPVWDVKLSANSRTSEDLQLIATAAALAFLNARLAADRDTWEMMAEKATEWLQARLVQLQIATTAADMVRSLETIV